MTHHENIACRWYERVWNQNDVDAIAELGTPDMKAHGADGVLRTPEMFADFQRAMKRAMPDVHVEVRHCVQGGDTIAVHRSQTIFKVTIDTYEAGVYRRIASGFGNPRCVRDAPLRIA